MEISRRAHMAIDQMEQDCDEYLKKRKIHKILNKIREDLREIDEVWK
jgi:hypothetical protein